MTKIIFSIIAIWFYLISVGWLGSMLLRLEVYGWWLVLSAAAYTLGYVIIFIIINKLMKEEQEEIQTKNKSKGGKKK